MARVNILKQIKLQHRWKLLAIPKDRHGRKDWKALPDGRYFIEWYEGGKRRRQAAGVTVAEAQEVPRRKKHVLEGRALGLHPHDDHEETRKIHLHVAVKRYLEAIEELKKPNTARKYRAVLDRFLAFFTNKTAAHAITSEDLNTFMVHLKKHHRLDNNTVIHNIVIVAQFLKKQGRAGLTRGIDLPQRITALPQEYTDLELKRFFKACSPPEHVLFLAFLLTGFREQEIVHLAAKDINLQLHTIRVTAKPDLGFYPKRWEEREVPVPKHLIELLKKHPRIEKSGFVFPSPRGNRELHMLDKCKAIAENAGLDPSLLA